MHHQGSAWLGLEKRLFSPAAAEPQRSQPQPPVHYVPVLAMNGLSPPRNSYDVSRNRVLRGAGGLAPRE